jgi:hypothetical protein
MAQIDSAWAVQILSGVMSPLTALERRLGRPLALLETVRVIVGGRRIQRIDSRVAEDAGNREIAPDLAIAPRRSGRATDGHGEGLRAREALIG